MRGDDNQQERMFSYISPEKRVPENHPLRPIRKLVDEILKEMSPRSRSVIQKSYCVANRDSGGDGWGCKCQLIPNRTVGHS